jgi:FAD/FMN-containing dehydrogenase
MISVRGTGREGKGMTRPVIRNWNNSVLSTPQIVATPKDLQELIDVVKNTVNYPSPVRAGGSFHSLNACFACNGTQILLTNFDDINVDLAAMTVTVGASVELIQIRDALRPHGMQLEVSPEIGNATAGSVACCGTKDASLGLVGPGQVSSTVIGVKMVTAEGKVETVSDTSDLDRMRVLRSSYGLLGIIFEVTFRIQKQSVLSYKYSIFDLTSSSPSRDELFDGADGVLAFCQPYSNRLVAEQRRVLSGSAHVSLFSRLKRFTRDKIWADKASFFTTLLPFNWFFPIFDRAIVLVFDLLSRLGGFNARRSDSNIDYKFNRTHYFDFTFWAIPVSHWEEFLPKFTAFCRDYFRETGFRTSLVASAYFINKDQRALLSFSSSEDIFTMDIADSRPNDPLWLEFNRRYNIFVAQFGARPLLNQTKELSRDVVRQTLGHDWEKLLAYQEKGDPGGRFLNRYFADLFPVAAKHGDSIGRKFDT